MLEIKNVTKKYRHNVAVNDISLTVEAGQVLGLIGANGAGKSTLINMIATLEKPDSGNILFDGRDIVKEPSAIRKILGYIPQDIALYESLTGIDNLKFWGRSYGVPKDRIDEEIARVCRIISFDDELLKKKVCDYSGGMKRRLNIGVALLHNPSLVVLDEPTTGIDLESADQILSAIEALRDGGCAIIYVGHYLEEIERISTHICILDKGKITAYGTLKELLEKSGSDSLEKVYRGR